MGNKTLATYAYGDKNGLLLGQTYGNGDKVSFTYDDLGRAKTTTYLDENNNVDRVLSYIYTGDGQLYSVHDSATGYTYIYTYDSLGRLIASRVEDANSETLMRTKLWYNASNQITKQTWTIGDTTYQETYAYNTGDATLSSYQNALGQTVSLGYDFLRRLSTVTAGDIYTQTYTYRDIDDSKTTTQVSGLAYSGFTGAPSYGYTYDVLGNILTYTENGTAYAYTYDDLNQLLTATGGGKAWAYTYDLGGNILTATDGTTSHTYTYGDADWADLLTAFDGEAITYDGSGNPLSYYNGSRYTFTWSEGRNLVSAAEGTNTYTYAYDNSGLRVSKTVNGVKHNYLYASGKLLRETYGNTTLDFLYDNHGSPYALIYTAGETTATYYYITNLQGDVLGLIDASGNSVASYTYDPYGKVLTATGTMAETNPLRYRGYYYDSESGLYYLQSRYYDPTTCRFINADAYASTGQGVLGHNMFTYCLNNPANLFDSAGTLCWALFDDYQLMHHNIRVYFSGVGGGGYPQGGVATRGHYVSIKEFLDTSDPEIVYENLDKYGMAYYNGVPVFRANLREGEAFSFGIIVLDDEYTCDQRGINALNHEYGHRLHMDEMGVLNYTMYVAIPSLIGAGVSNLKIIDFDYYSLPWEYVADRYGNVTRNSYTEWAYFAGSAYWALTKIVDTVMGGII